MPTTLEAPTWEETDELTAKPETADAPAWDDTTDVQQPDLVPGQQAAVAPPSSLEPVQAGQPIFPKVTAPTTQPSPGTQPPDEAETKRALADQTAYVVNQAKRNPVVGPVVGQVGQAWEAAQGGRDPLAGLETLVQPPAQYLGTQLKRGGEALLGTIEDLALPPEKDPRTGKYQTSVLPANLISSDFEKPSYFSGEESPRDKAIKELEDKGYKWPMAVTKTARGLIESAPQMAAQATLGPEVGPAVWGLSPEGFDPATAATMYLLPMAKEYGGQISEKVATKLGVSNPTAQQVVNRVMGGATAAGLVSADQIRKLVEMTPEERKKSAPEIIGSGIAMFLMSLQDSGPPKAPVETGSGTADKTGAEWVRPEPLKTGERRNLFQRALEKVNSETDPETKASALKKLDQLEKDHSEGRKSLSESKTLSDKMGDAEELVNIENRVRRILGEPEIETQRPVTAADQAKSDAWYKRRVSEIEQKLKAGETITDSDRQDWGIGGRDQKELPEKPTTPEAKPAPAAPEKPVATPVVSHDAAELEALTALEKRTPEQQARMDALLAKDKAAKNKEAWMAQMKAAVEKQRAADTETMIPALRTKEGKIIPGEKGKTHEDIYKGMDRITGLELQVSEPEHGFLVGDRFLTRTEAAKAVGETGDLHSQRLRELQKAPEAPKPAPTPAETPSPFKAGDQVDHQGRIKTIRRMSPDGKFAVLGNRAIPIREIKAIEKPAPTPEKAAAAKPAEPVPVADDLGKLVESGMESGSKRSLPKFSISPESNLADVRGLPFTEPQKEIVDRLVELGFNPKIRVVKDPRIPAASYNGSAGILLNSEKLQSNPHLAIRGIVHEAVHDATHSAIRNPANAQIVSRLTELMSYAMKTYYRNRGKFGGQSNTLDHAFKNVDEFVTGAFTSGRVRKALSKMELGQRTGVKPSAGTLSVFGRFMQLVSDLLGLKGKSTLLEEVVKSGEELIKSRTKPESPISFDAAKIATNQDGLAYDASTPAATPEPITPEPKPAAPAPGEGGMGPGPGAQTSGTDRPSGSQLQQLSQAVRLQSISPKEPFGVRLRAALDLASMWGRGKDAATQSLAKLTAAKDALWSAYKNLPEWNNFTASLGKWIGTDQQTAMQVRDFQKAITRTVPNKLRREAITNWIQAGGDESVLRARADASKPAARRGYETALKLNDAEKTLARNIGSYLESRLQEGIDAGLLKQGVDAYVNQIWKRPTAATQKMWADLFGGGTLNPNFKFAKQRIFESYFEGEQAGFIPKTKDIGQLISTYDMAFNRALSARALIRDLQRGKAKDGKPIVMTSGQGTPLPKGETPPEAILIKPNHSPKGAVTEDGRPYRPIDHWALRDWKWASKAGDTDVFVQGDMLVHPDHWQHLNNVLKTSRLQQNPITSTLLKVGAFAKQTKLSLSPFHTVQEGVHAMAHRVNPVNPDAIDLSVPEQKSLLDHGLMISDPRGYELFTEGMSGGGLVGKIPGLGHLQQWYTEMTFKDYIPRLKMSMATDALARNRSAYAKQIKSGKVTDDQVVALTARESNAAFGEQNYRMMGRSATVQDFLRLSLLAPDFLEARARFVGQALKPYGREQRIALTLMGATLYTAARVMNKSLDDDYHWDKPFSVFNNGKEYRLRTILGDVQHLMTDPRSFWYNRLSPVTRTISEYVTGRDDRGIKRNSLEQFGDFLSWFKPIPLQIRPGETVTQAALASAGVPSKTYGKQQELYEVLDRWRSKQTDPKIKEAYDRQRGETHVQSPYGPLRMALNNGDTKSAREEYQKLLITRTPEKIRDTINPFTGGKVNVRTGKVSPLNPKPFTGSRLTESKFIESLSPEQRKIYAQTRQEREKMLNLFDAMPK